MVGLNLWLVRYEGLPITTFEENQTILYFLLVGFLTLLAYVRAYENTYLQELFRAFSDINFIEHLKRQGKFKYRLANLVLDLIYLGTISIFIYNIQFSEVLTIGQVFLWVLGYFVIKIMFAAVVGVIFYGNDGVKLFVNHLMVFDRIVGVTLLPLVFISAFMEQPYQQLTLGFVGGLLLFLLMVRIGRSLIQVKVKLNYGLLYNFLYICTIEITPLIIVLKLITQKLLN